MIPFDNIPNDLRSSLFFAEISVNGSVPTISSNNEPTPPLISCDGAVTSITFPELSGVWDIELDNDYYNATEREIVQWLQSSFDSTFNTQQIGSAVNIGNIDTGNHRFKLIPVHSTSFQSPTDNTTFTVADDGSLTFCLSPAI